MSEIATTEEKKSNKKYIYMIVGFLVLIIGFALYQRWSKGGWSDAPDAAINEYDETTIDSVLSGEEGTLPYALPDDESPAFFTVPQNGYTDEAVIELVKKIGERHSTKIAAIAAQYASDAATVMDVSAVLLLSGPSGTITQAGIDLWFTALEKWTPMFIGVNDAVASGIAEVAAAQVAGINNATECVATTFVKNVTETSDTTDTTFYQVEIKNSSSRGFLGMNKKKSSSETRTSIRTLTRNDVRKIEYVPHCTNWQLDPTQFAGIMEAGTLSLEALYGMLTAVLKTAPRAEQFVKLKVA